MSKCDLFVEFDQSGPLSPGQELTGSVVLTPDSNLDLSELVIEQVWQTHGRGNQDQGKIARQVEHGRRCSAGQSYRFGFTFQTPCWPLSYHGTLVNVDHYVSARADVPWKIDPRAKTAYLVAPGTGSRDAAVAEHLGQGKDRGEDKMSMAPKILFWLFLPVFAVLLLMLATLVLPILLVVAVVMLVRRVAAERRLGKVLVEVGARRLGGDAAARSGPRRSMWARLRDRLRSLKGPTYLVAPGATVPVTLRFTPPTAVKLNEITLQLKTVERARSGSGTNATTYLETLVEEKTRLLGQELLPDGAPVELHGELVLPTIEAWSFKATSNEVKWQLSLRIDIANSPDWTQDHTLIVAPPDDAHSIPSYFADRPGE